MTDRYPTDPLAIQKKLAAAKAQHCTVRPVYRKSDTFGTERVAGVFEGEKLVNAIYQRRDGRLQWVDSVSHLHLEP